MYTMRPNLRQDLVSIRDLATGKISSAWKVAPLYLPAHEPVGSKLTVRSGLDDKAEIGSIEHRQVLPARTIDLGNSRSLDVPPLHAFSIQSARVITDARAFAGFVSDRGAIVAEVSEDYRARGGDYASLVRLQRYPRRRRRVGHAASLLTGGGGSPTYFHWLYDVLPRIALLECADYLHEGIVYIVPRLDHPYMRDTLQLLGIDLSSCVQLEGPAVIEASSLAVSEGHRSYRRVEPWIPQFLRDRLLVGKPTTGRKFYANRRDATVRRILNEDRLEAALLSRGFESIALSSYSFSEKVQLFASADLVIAPHGAGLSHVCFSSPGTRVVDVRDPAFYWPVFEDAARAVGVRYKTVDALSMIGWSRLPQRVRHMTADVDRILDVVDDELRGI